MHADLLIANILFAQHPCFSSCSFWPSTQISADLCWGKGWELADLLKDEGWMKQTKMVTAGKPTTPEAGWMQGRKGLELPETRSLEEGHRAGESQILEDKELSWAMRQLVLGEAVGWWGPARVTLMGRASRGRRSPLPLLCQSLCQAAQTAIEQVESLTTGVCFLTVLVAGRTGQGVGRFGFFWGLFPWIAVDCLLPESSWGFPSGHIAGVGCHFLLQRIFLIGGLSPGL